MSFKGLKGQESLKTVLFKGLENNRISHAVLLTGPVGSGKKTWGRALSQSLLCTGRRGAEPCGSCLSCRQFTAGKHLRYFDLTPRGRWIKIEQIREVRSKLYLSAGKKVCLINPAEDMTAEAASALLKILEEPPGELHFILLAAQQGRLLKTVLSRCQRYNMQLLSNEEIMDILMHRGIKSPEKATLITRLSGGLPGRALALAEDPAFEKRMREGTDIARRLLDKGFSIRQTLETAESLAGREDLLDLAEVICLYLRDCLLGRLCPDGEGPVKEDNIIVAGGNKELIELENMVKRTDQFNKELITTNVNRRLALEALFIELQGRLA